jgi:hypothetical protein
MLVLVFALLLLAVSARADTLVLGSAGTYAALGYSGVTNSGVTTINGGNVGSFPTNSLTGDTLCPSADCYAFTGGGIVTATAANQTDLANAIAALSGLSSQSLAPGALSGNVTVLPGVYSASTLLLNGTLKLNAEGENNVDFIFLVTAAQANALTAAVGSNVVLENQGSMPSTDGVYWVESAGGAVLDGSTFVGNDLAYSSVTMTAGEDITCGSALANTGDVTFINDTITTGCNSLYFSGPGSTGAVITTNGGATTTTPGAGSAPVATPEPGTFALLSSGLLGLGFLAFRKSRVSPLI